MQGHDDDLDGKSLDIVQTSIESLTQMFPDVLTDGRIDFDALRAVLGDDVDDAPERYRFNWYGKAAARRISQTPSSGTLRPLPAKSLEWDTTKNLFIEGDNLEVLKLLQKPYYGRVKLVYIDPPYNTGNEFIYPDRYEDNLQTYLRYTGQMDSEGLKMSANAETSGRFHTNWLNMMLPRLRLARNLMRDDGVIIVSCDDHEQPRLRMIMDEVFGEENFVAQIVWQRSKKGDAKLIANVHEYIVCYVRDKDAVLANGVWRKKKEGADEVLAHYSDLRRQYGDDHGAIRAQMMKWYRELPAGDPRKNHKHYNWSDARGLYFPDNFAGPDDGRASRPRHDILHPVTGKPVKKPSTGWRWDEKKTAWALEQDPPRIHFGPDETTIPARKSYLEEIGSEPYSSVFYRDGRSATLQVESLVGKGWFPFPKNTEILAELIELTTGPNDVVLDFFAGSGSTAHAVMDVNVAHDSHRRYIMVQLPEPTGREGYDSIADIGETRLRAAAEVIKRDHPGYEGDLGFRVFGLDSSNLSIWDSAPDDVQRALLEAVDNVKTDRGDSDVLYEILLKLGIDLATPIEEVHLASCPVFVVGMGALVVVLTESMPAGLTDEIAELRERLDPEVMRVVFRDASFPDDVAKTNAIESLRQHGILDVKCI